MSKKIRQQAKAWRTLSKAVLWGGAIGIAVGILHGLSAETGGWDLVGNWLNLGVDIGITIGLGINIYEMLTSGRE